MGETETAASEQDTSHDVRALIPGYNGGSLLEPYKPGQSGNPRGRPTDEERLVRRMLRRHPGAPDDAADELAAVLRNSKSKHWLGALREYLDRTEGTVQQSTHHHVSTDRAIVTHAPSGNAPSLPGVERSVTAELVPAELEHSSVPVPASVQRGDGGVAVGGDVQAVGVGSVEAGPDASGTPSVGAGGTGGVPDAATPHALGTPSHGPEQAGAGS